MQATAEATVEAAEKLHESIKIPVSAIVVAKGHKIVKSKRDDLVKSLRVDGLLQDIGVRPCEDGTYAIVFGRHRLAAAKQLGWTEIGAKLLVVTEDEAIAAEHAENLFRRDLDKAEYLASVAAWHTVYRRRFPLVAGPSTPKPGVAAANKARAAKSGKPEADSDPLGATAEPETVAPESSVEAPAVAFAKQLAATTDQSLTQAKQTVRIATNLDDEQRAILCEKEVPTCHMDTIAKLAADAKERAVKLIASGMDPRSAIAEATAPPNASSTLVEQANAPGFRAEKDMTDDEWVAEYCGDMLERLTKNPAAFKADAILYRKTFEAAAEFRKAIKRHLKGSSAAKGAFAFLLTRLANLSHPKDWLVCGPCGGTGLVDQKKCGNCNGDGYRVKTGG